MKASSRFVAVATALMLAASSLAFGQKYHTGGTVITPQSGVVRPGSRIGAKVYTNFKLMMPTHSFTGAVQPNIGPPYPGYLYETPASIGCIYGFVTRTPGCDPNVALINPTGGSRAIAIVDAFDYPEASSDLATFSGQFGLPAANFTTVYATGVQPPEDSTGGWELEAALDIEWAHAMAPDAQIFLVEAASNSGDDMYFAEDVAAGLVAAAGGGEVSNSWGFGGEYDGELSDDIHFQTPGVVYLFSSGDSPIAQYPAVSPYVVAVGGTTVVRNQTNGTFLGEGVWTPEGAGPSFLEPRPAFQNVVKSMVHNQRGTVDVAADADPNTGVWVYATNVNGTGWWIFGGTSVSTPMWAGIVNRAGHFYNTSQDENSAIYSNIGNKNAYTDITKGQCYYWPHQNAGTGWDFCSGAGSPRGYAGK